MAIAASRPVSGLASTSNLSSYAMTAFTPSANCLLVVLVGAQGTVQATPTMTGGSLTWTREAIANNIGGSGASQVIFWAKVGGSPVSTAPTFDCTGDAGTGCFMTVIEFTGYDVNAANPIQQTKMPTAATTSTDANITFASALNTLNGYAIAWGGGLAAGSSAAPSGWTEADDMGFASPTSNMSTAYRAGGESTAGAFTFTNASTTWLAWGVEVKVDPGTPSTFLKDVIGGLGVIPSKR